MQIHAPSMTVFLTAVALWLLALAGHFNAEIPVASQYHFWLAIAAGVILIIDCVVKRPAGP